jgi:protein-tyrosine-phosphatase
MVENMQQIELQKLQVSLPEPDSETLLAHFLLAHLQLVNSLTQTAEALRNAASMAETFAAALHTTALSPGGSSSTQSPLLNLFPNFANSGLPSQLQQQLQQQGHSAASQLSQQIIQHLAQQSDQLLQQQQGNAAGQKEEPTRRKRKRVSAAAGGDEKPTRKRRVKDPDAPKRPPSAYLLFQNEVRKEMVKQHDGLPYHEVLAEIAKRWGEMSDEQKRVSVVRCSECSCAHRCALSVHRRCTTKLRVKRKLSTKLTRPRTNNRSLRKRRMPRK